MSCTGCNDGCFDESVQLQVGPVGPQGATGANGICEPCDDGIDGVSILFQNTSVSSPTTIGSSYTDVIFSNAPITIPSDTLLNVGDMLRLEVVFQNDTVDSASAITFFGQIKFGASQVWEMQIGHNNGNYLFNGLVISLDLIVTATNTLSTRLNSRVAGFGSRVLQRLLTTTSLNSYSLVSIPTIDSSGATIGSITPDLTIDNNITVQVKNTSGVATDLASITSILVTKFKKSQ